MQSLSAKEVASSVGMRQLLELLGFETNARSSRCPCLLHGGRNRTAFSWREDGRWYCFSCGRGGDRIALVRAVKKCGFRDAVVFLARMAGVRFRIHRTCAGELRRIAKIRQRAQQLAWQLRDEIVAVRGSYRDRLHRADRLQRIIGEDLRCTLTPEKQEQQWNLLARLAPVVTFYLAAHYFLNQADPPTLISFVRASNSARRKMILEGLA